MTSARSRPEIVLYSPSKVKIDGPVAGAEEIQIVDGGKSHKRPLLGLAPDFEIDSEVKAKGELKLGFIVVRSLDRKGGKSGLCADADVRGPE